MSFIVVIPARYASTRLPGKPLRKIAGRPMIEHVWRRARESGAADVVIATDDERIAGVAGGFGAQVCLTDRAHVCGTDRIAEVAARLGLDDERLVVNLQGDEPAMPPALIDQVAFDLAHHETADFATLCEAIDSEEELGDPHVVKLVMDCDGHALYFSRAPIPWRRDRPGTAAGIAGLYRHVGLYACRVRALREFVSWGPCDLERVEALEQLRILWHGRRIHVAVACETAGEGIDTEADLARIEARLLSGRGSGVS